MFRANDKGVEVFDQDPEWLCFAQPWALLAVKRYLGIDTSVFSILIALRAHLAPAAKYMMVQYTT